jgi:hypothetical protein
VHAAFVLITGNKHFKHAKLATAYEIRQLCYAVAMLLSSSSSTCLQLARVLPCALQLLRHSSTVAENVKQWQAKATKELKGKDPLQTLAFETADVSSSYSSRAVQQTVHH